jgi:hypothetical protein
VQESCLLSVRFIHSFLNGNRPEGLIRQKGTVVTRIYYKVTMQAKLINPLESLQSTKERQ